MDEEMRQPEEMVSVIDGKKVQENLGWPISQCCYCGPYGFYEAYVEGRLQNQA